MPQTRLNGQQLSTISVAFHCCCFTMAAELCCCFATPTPGINVVRLSYTYAQSQLASAEWVIKFCPHSSPDYVADPRHTLTGEHLAPTVLSSSIPVTNMPLTECHTSDSHQNLECAWLCIWWCNECQQHVLLLHDSCVYTAKPYKRTCKVKVTRWYSAAAAGQVSSSSPLKICVTLARVPERHQWTRQAPTQAWHLHCLEHQHLCPPLPTAQPMMSASPQG